MIMFPKVTLLPCAISEIMASVSENRVLTKSDRYGLMTALVNNSLNEDEEYAINRLLRFVAKGKVSIK